MVELIKYIFFGVTTTIINIVSFMFMNHMGLDYRVSNVIAWTLSVSFAFYTNKKYVFNSKSNDIEVLKKESISFISARVFSLVLDMSLMILLINFMNINELTSKIIVNILVVILNYLLSKFYIFSDKK